MKLTDMVKQLKSSHPFLASPTKEKIPEGLKDSSDFATIQAGAEPQVVTITPDQADRILKTNYQNRTINSSRVNQYARDMETGRWRVNGETIILDEEGRLLDGQHRLAACVKSNRPFDTILVRGVERDARLTVDSGMSRRLSHRLTMFGFKDGAALSTTVGWWKRIAEGPSAIRRDHFKVSETEALETLVAEPQIAEAIQHFNTLREELPREVWTQAMGLFPRSAFYRLVAFYAHAAAGHEEKAREFVRRLLTGLDIHSPQDPIYLLRSRLATVRGRNPKLQVTRHETMSWFDVAALIYTWNLYVGNEKRTLLRIGTDIPPMKYGPVWADPTS